MRMPGAALVLSLLLLALAPSAARAEGTWEYQGVTFTPRAGWCAAPGVDAGGVTSFIAKPCDQQWPQLSMAPVFPAGSPMAQSRVEDIMSQLMVHANSAGERERVAGIGRRTNRDCVMTSYNVETDSLPGLSSIGVRAYFQCPVNNVAYRNITLLVRARNGAIWGIAGDYGGLNITSDDVAQVRGLMDAIASQ